MDNKATLNDTHLKKKKKLKKKPFMVIWLSFLILFLSILGYSVYNTILWFIDNQKISNVAENILEIVNVNELTDNSSSVMVNEPVSKTDIYFKYKDVPLIDVDINSLKKENNDTIGWIQVMGTNINYPVVQTDNNDYYLTHDFRKNYNRGGWVFLDYRNNIDLLENNTIIYGHRRYNESMFGSLKNVLTKSWLNNTDNHIIKVSTLKYNYLFQVFSVYSVPNESYYIKTNFVNDEYDDFLKTIQDRSIYNFNTEVNNKAKILTLSTCHNDNDRLVVHSKLITVLEKN